MRSRLVVVTLLAIVGCAGKQGPGPEPGSSVGPIAEADAAYLEDACAHYLSDAPPPSTGEFMPVSEEDMAAAMAMVEHEVMPRCAHYHLAHNALVIMLFDDPRTAHALWAAKDPLELLDILADGVNGVCTEDNPDEWRMPKPGFRLGRTELLGRPVVVVDVIPPPVATTEAHLFAVVGRPWPAGVDHSTWTGLDRYFVLEHSVTQGPTHTVMGGWTRADERNTHLNFGRGPVPTPEAFLHVIGQNLCADFTKARTTMPRH